MIGSGVGVLGFGGGGGVGGFAALFASSSFLIASFSSRIFIIRIASSRIFACFCARAVVDARDGRASVTDERSILTGGNSIESQKNTNWGLMRKLFLL